MMVEYKLRGINGYLNNNGYYFWNWNKLKIYGFSSYDICN